MDAAVQWHSRDLFSLLSRPCRLLLARALLYHSSHNKAAPSMVSLQGQLQCLLQDVGVRQLCLDAQLPRGYGPDELVPG